MHEMRKKKMICFWRMVGVKKRTTPREETPATTQAMTRPLPKMHSPTPAEDEEQFSAKSVIVTLLRGTKIYHGYKCGRTFGRQSTWTRSFFTLNEIIANRAYGPNVKTVELSVDVACLNICNRDVVKYLEELGLYKSTQPCTDEDCPLGIHPDTNRVFRVSNKRDDLALFSFIETHLKKLKQKFGQFDCLFVPDGIDGEHHNEIFIPEDHHDRLIWQSQTTSTETTETTETTVTASSHDRQANGKHTISRKRRPLKFLDVVKVSLNFD